MTSGERDELGDPGRAAGTNYPSMKGCQERMLSMRGLGRLRVKDRMERLFVEEKCFLFPAVFFAQGVRKGQRSKVLLGFFSHYVRNVLKRSKRERS